MDSSFDTFMNDIDPDINYFESHIFQNQVFCSYNSIDELKLNNPSILNDSNFFSVFNQNIRSFNANLDNFMLLFDENSMPDCIIFSETWHDGEEPILIPGYTGYHTVRQLRRSVGVSIFFKEH